MKQTICDICGKQKGDEKENIEGKLRFCNYTHNKDMSVSIMTCESKEVYLCADCSKMLMRCVNAMKEHKRIRFGRWNE